MLAIGNFYLIYYSLKVSLHQLLFIGDDMLLLKAHVSEQVRVTAINTDDKTKNRLQNIGVIVGCKIVLMQSNFGDIIVKVRDCRLAMNKDVAKSIEVEPIVQSDDSAVSNKEHKENTIQ